MSGWFDTNRFVAFETVTKDEIAVYLDLFHQMDNGTGVVTGADAKSFFPQSGLPKQQLAVIWRTADVDLDSRLNSAEFVLAMHLCSAALLGYEIPTSWMYPVPDIASADLANNMQNMHIHAAPNHQAPARGARPPPPNHPPNTSRPQQPPPHHTVQPHLPPNPIHQNAPSTYNQPPPPSRVPAQTVQRGPHQPLPQPVRTTTAVVPPPAAAAANQARGRVLPMAKRAELKAAKFAQEEAERAAAAAAPVVLYGFEDPQAMNWLWPSHGVAVNQQNVPPYVMPTPPPSVQTTIGFFWSFINQDWTSIQNYVVPQMNSQSFTESMLNIRSSMGSSDQLRLFPLKVFDKGNITTVYFLFLVDNRKWGMMTRVQGGKICSFWAKTDPLDGDFPELTEGLTPKLVIAQEPRRILCYDGKVMEIYDEEDEIAAMRDPNVPLGLMVGETMGWSIRMSSTLKFESHTPKAMIYHPPELSGQCLVPGTIVTKPTQSDVPELGVTIIESKSGAVDPLVLQYHIATRATRLSPMYVNERFVQCPRPTDRQMAGLKAPTLKINYTVPAVQRYLDDTGLRIQPGESVIEFAKRGYAQVALDFTYIMPSEPNMSGVIERRMGDCGGLNSVFVGILRANGVPARLLYGRHAKSTGVGQTEEIHIQSQFYVDHIGWIPTDVTMCVHGKNPRYDPQDWKSLLYNFGWDNGKFLTFTIQLSSEFDSNAHLLDRRNLNDYPQSFSFYGKCVASSPSFEAERLF
ncbi:transglutaminase-like enzyme, predicted cysteine protease [Planoprotostelium fungivorum]|uniref:Transglutaminase-like enzyme, predicted cysteine protease n=1 Tax=Planoprotostelium fungivorum TaxID=1890364 RepID=A0A2P6NUL5_9EUKA|nr:transglutaminase-like enzyme, predicted cysteine protease [Planoprotostelium fungivorum]PRP87662.1 transglutaminase-like enzyme, predicted cysteine protease [Planoprotostelium fungivorum]